jgi:hypothetical protein
MENYTRRISVKNTFLDFKLPRSDSDGDFFDGANGQSSVGQLRRRARASSDPGLFDNYGAPEFDEERDDIIMTGLDDDDVETDDEAIGQGAPLQCYQHIVEDEMNVKAVPFVPFKDNGWPTTSLKAAWQVPAAAPEVASSRTSSHSVADSTESQPATNAAVTTTQQWSPELQQQVDRLATENARLAEENRLLAEACREAASAANAAVAANYSRCQLSASLPANNLPEGAVAVAAPAPWWNQSDGHVMCIAMPIALDMDSYQVPMQQPSQEESKARTVTPTTTISQMSSSQQQVGNRKQQRLQQQQHQRGGQQQQQQQESWPAASPAEDAPNVQDGSTFAGGRTTVMLRNLPNNYSRTMLIAMIDGEGFAGQYDFVYLPMDFNTKACLGYAFINLLTIGAAERFWCCFDGYSNWVIPSRKHCGVSWSNPHQGLKSNIDRYKNSPVMHEAVPEEYKPIVFEDGEPIAFPQSTKKIRVPRVRNYSESNNNGGAMLKVAPRGGEEAQKQN